MRTCLDRRRRRGPDGGDLCPWYLCRERERERDLEHEAAAGPGDFLFIPPGVPHVVRNTRATEPAVAVLARTDPHEQEDMTELPALEARARERLEA